MLKISDYTSVNPTVAWQVQDLIEHSGITALIGQPNCGKTFLAVDLACSVATGTKALCGNIPVQQGNVLYIATESLPGVRHRVNSWQQAHHLTINPASFAMSTTGTANLSDAGDLEELEEAIGQRHVVLTVIDTWSLANPTMDENSSNDVNGVIHNLNRLRQKLDTSFLIVHHMGKAKNAGARGSNALLGAVDTELRLEEDDSGRGGRRLTCFKQRNALRLPGGFVFDIAGGSQESCCVSNVEYCRSVD